MTVVYYGFNKKLGNISYYDSTGQRDAGIQKPFSEETGKLIDEEVRKLKSSGTIIAERSHIQRRPGKYFGEKTRWIDSKENKYGRVKYSYPCPMK